jgi:hypothetical protein
MTPEHEERFRRIAEDYLERPGGDYAELLRRGEVSSPEGVDPEQWRAEIRAKARADKIRVITIRSGDRAIAARNRTIPKDQGLAELTAAMERGETVRPIAERARLLGHEIGGWVSHDEERADQRRVEIVEVKLGWLFAELSGGEREQQPERVAVSGDRSRAGVRLVDQPVGEERLQRRREQTHGSTSRSRRSRASARSSGEACKYQSPSRPGQIQPAPRVLRADAPGDVVPVTRDEFNALMSVTQCWRDRLLLVLMRHAGLRRGEAVNLCEEDLHFVSDARELGCRARGAHLHVRRRTTEQGSPAKSRCDRMVPVDAVIVFCADRRHYERERIPGAESSRTVLVNVAGERAGRPRRSSPPRASTSKPTNRRPSAAFASPRNIARQTAAKSCTGRPSRALTTTNCPSNKTDPGGASASASGKPPSRAVRLVPWRDHARTRRSSSTSISRRKPSHLG